MKKLLCFLATEKGCAVLRHALEKGLAGQVAAVVSFPEVNMRPAWHGEIEKLCANAGLPFYLWAQVRDGLPALIRESGATGAVAVAWRYMLPLSLNALLEDPLIVFHDSLLPRYRGFAPTPTAMLCGERKIGVTALYAAEAVDAGPILWQREMPLGPDDYIAEVITRQAALYAEGFAELLAAMEKGGLNPQPQNEAEATYSLWRSVEDCRIDWALPAKDIYALVRACGPPYPGAFTRMERQKITVLRAKLLPDKSFVRRDAGKLWQLLPDGPAVVCGEGMLQITQAVDEEGLTVRFARLRLRLG